jgi:NADH-ubiquinone oxidoreductase chain 5
MISTI